MSLYKKLLAGVAATAAFILPGDFSARKPEAPAVQNGLEAILNSDWIEETSVPNIFEKPTEADELTINTLKTYINDYYKKLDKLVDAGKNFDEKQSNNLISKTVNSPLLQYIWTHNPELRDFIGEKTNNNPNLTGEQLVDCLDKYLLRKGYCFLHHSRNAGFGTAHSFRLAKIKKITRIRGKIWNNIVDNEVRYLEWPILADEYYARRSSEKEKTVYTAVAADEIILVNSGSHEFSLDKILTDLKNFDLQEVKNQDDVTEVLMKKGLKSLSKHEFLQEFIEQRIKSELFHEAMHIIYRRTYIEPSNPEQIHDYQSFNEAAAFLTELKNEKTDLIYYTLGNIFDLRKNSYYEKANKIVFCHFIKQIEGNRQKYQNIDFTEYDKNKDADKLILELPKLSISQIRELATNCFNETFPELDKLYNPAGK